MKNCLAQGSSGRRVTLLPGTTFLYINGANDDAELAKARGLGPTNEVHRMKARSLKSSKSKTNKEDNPEGGTKCKHCGKRNHSAEKCKFKHATCHKCNKPGHIALVCKSSKKSQVHAVEEKLSDSEENTNEEFDDYSYLYNIQGGLEKPIMILKTNQFVWKLTLALESLSRVKIFTMIKS